MVRIRPFEQDDMLHIVVEDNGVGYEERAGRPGNQIWKKKQSIPIQEVLLI